MKRCCTFLGEKTPRVPPSSRMATPISASSASLKGGKENIRPMLNDIAFNTLAVSNKDSWKIFLEYLNVHVSVEVSVFGAIRQLLKPGTDWHQRSTWTHSRHSSRA